MNRELKGAPDVTSSAPNVGEGLERRQKPRARLPSLKHFRHFVRQVPRIVRSISQVEIRQATPLDIAELLKVEEAAWAEESRASRDMLASRIETFSQGVICGVSNGKIVGFACLQIIPQTLDQITGDWMTLTDGGFIRASHDENGSTLFGVSLSVIPGAPRDMAFALCEAAKKLTIRKELPWAVVGSRIPGYHRFAGKVAIQEYIFGLRSNRHIDPELDLYRRVGMTPVRILPNFFPDEESCNYGVLMAWKNPFKELSDRLNLWEDYQWFSLWESKTRRERTPWRI